jgi:hypothetical protein
MMAEAFRQHLQNLSWWEQIDRFFNPGKYSCTTTWVPTDTQLLFMLAPIIIMIVAGSIMLAIFYFQKDLPDASELSVSGVDKK